MYITNILQQIIMNKKKFFAILTSIILISCIETKQRGFYFGSNIEKIENFDTYNFTKKDLLNNFGYPNIELSDNSWLYYSYTTKNFKIFKPKLVNEKVLLVNFDKNDYIVNYHYKELKNQKIIDNTDIDNKNSDTFLNTLFKGLIMTPLN